MTYAWDFNGDGTTDASGPSPTYSYPAGGTYTAKLLVTDDLGSTSSATQSLTVADTPSGAGSGAAGGSGSGGSGQPSAPADSGSPAAGANPTFDSTAGSTPAISLPSMLKPLPFIHIKGHTTGRGAQIDLFTVKAPAGSRLTVACVAKRGCGRKLGQFKVRARKGRATGLVRVRWIEGWRRAGTLIKVRVTKPGFIGRYTQFRIGRLKPPVRWDGCLLPGHNGRPTDCQGGV
jgi:hypothetical protein